MNWCKPHWDELRKAIEDRGLSGFGARSGQAAINEIAAQLQGADEMFDPLLGSWMRINQWMLESPALNGRILQCPCCILVEDGQPDLVAQWINGVTGAALAYATEHGLIKAH